MKLMLILFAVVSVATACTSRRRQEEFEAYRRTYRKVYKDEIEYNYRCGVFNDNMDIIENHNFRYARSMESYTLGVNKFTDYTREEFVSLFTGLKPELEERNRAEIESQNVFKFNPNLKAPATANWTSTGHVADIRDQGKCGSCYSFATIGVVEAHRNIKHNKPHHSDDLSEQHIVDCSYDHKNQGCNGGLMTNSYNYLIKERHGLEYEHNYPYISAEGQPGASCSYQHSRSPYTITGFVEIEKNDAALEQAVGLYGPVAVGVNADTWAKYAGGVFCPTGGLLGTSSGCGTTLNILGLNHAVIVVGYTKDYWIIKNSWGLGWGEHGYMRLCRKFTNNCGICMMASYPIVQ